MWPYAVYDRTTHQLVATITVEAELADVLRIANESCAELFGGSVFMKAPAMREGSRT